MSRPDGPRAGDQPSEIVIRDKRRIDPVTLQPREPDRPTREREHERATGQVADGSAGERAQVEMDRTTVLETLLAERTADLQRLKAEYDNYRKRVRRDRLAIREIAVVNVLTGLLPVLDAIDQARERGELSGGLAAVADALGSQLATLGLESFGEPGEAFDPTRHEAVTDVLSADVDRPTCTAVLRAGYQVGQHLLRPAQVVVSEPRTGSDDG
ncbi:hypothetical protein GCM10010193_01480 [Kitasatospora atroaurantiaca]|uniref:Protein GrpE n=1 Tax=Kitasatospora atroaurantiaca TaxID=285545 RepID=A0A561EL81_9ACTN|nr:nucleotide exchange factor GrpE [Kitasatospora atroaurantiaca]TWE16371.1 molecular chaperone GrpE [Kitasatospora atroaurantiaca]